MLNKASIHTHHLSPSVFHLVKKPPSPNSKSSIIEKDYLKRTRSALYLNKLKKGTVLAIDTAGDESNACPREFFSSFCYAHESGLRNFTYHVGEDFRHLLTGLKNIFNTLNIYTSLGDSQLLNLRLGHATALGVDINELNKNTPDFTYTPISEVLDNIIWLYHIEHSYKKINKQLIKSETDQLSSIINNHLKNDIKLQDLLSHFLTAERKQLSKQKLRKLSKRIFKNKYYLLSSSLLTESNNSFNFSRSTIEKNLLKSLKTDTNSKKACLNYHYIMESKIVSKIYLQVPTSTNIKLLELLQQMLIKEVKIKNITIEIPITSNSKITHLTNFKSHFIFKWIEASSKKVPPKFILTSDDPGIFDSSLINEIERFYHTLIHEYSFEDDRARAVLIDLINLSQKKVFS